MSPLKPVKPEPTAEQRHVDAMTKGKGALSGRKLGLWMHDMMQRVIRGDYKMATALRAAVNRKALTSSGWDVRFKRMIPTEEAEHRTLARWLDNHPETKGRWFHVPNGEARDARTGRKLKDMGVKRGVPDIWIMHPRLIIIRDLKRLDGGKHDQDEWLGTCAAAGCDVGYCYGARHAQDDIALTIKRALAG